ncbi:MAG: O-antigen ligase family protein [Geminicoccaceae bacterium]
MSAQHSSTFRSYFDWALMLWAVPFVCFYATDAIYFFLRSSVVFSKPIELCLISILPFVLRVHLPDYFRNGLKSTTRFVADHLHVILPYLVLVLAGLAGAVLPGVAMASDSATKSIFILVYRFLVFAGAMSMALLLRQQGARWVLLSALAVLIYSIFWDLNDPTFESQVADRASGFPGNPNNSALVVVMLTAMAVRYDRVYVADLLVLFAAGVAVFLTLSRGGLFNYGIFLVVYLYFIGQGNRLRQMLVLPLVAAVTLPIAVFSVSHLIQSSEMFEGDNAQRRLETFSFNSRSEGVYDSDNIRLNLIPQYFALIDDSPIFGHGTGFSRSMTFRPHNMYLEFWVNNGIISLLSYIWFLLGILIISFKRHYPPGVALAIITIVGGFFSHSIAQYPAFLFSAGFAMSVSWLKVVDNDR